MHVRDLLDSTCSTCAEDTPVERVFQIMQESGSRQVVVIEGPSHRIPIGIVTEHEICAQILGRRRDPRGLLAANVMVPTFAKVEDSMLASKCRDVMERQGISEAVVVNAKGSVEGIISISALRSALAQHRYRSLSDHETWAGATSSFDSIF